MDLVQQEINVSPVLPDSIKNYLIDIDGTITDDVPNEDPERMKIVEPYEGSVDMINEWFNQGNIITFFTSRDESLREITEEWLKKHKYKYNYLLMNKPRGGNYHWIDNHIVRATRYNGKWAPLTTVNANIQVFEQ
jgi:uncharacterized HAD superfamily protein